jgi:hypothetical protein
MYWMKKKRQVKAEPDSIVLRLLELQKNPEFQKEIERFIKETTR